MPFKIWSKLKPNRPSLAGVAVLLALGAYLVGAPAFRDRLWLGHRGSALLVSTLVSIGIGAILYVSTAEGKRQTSPKTKAVPRRGAHLVWKIGHKCFNAAGKIPGLDKALATSRIQALREEVLARFVAGLPDRRYWSAAIMPVLLKAGFKKILFVGCGSYTRHVHEEFESTGCECWTTDIVPDNAVWGNPRRHLICDIADIRQRLPDAQFDAVLFNGVMGYGVTGAHMAAIAPALHASMHARGLLLIGWNTGLVEDPLTLPCVMDLFIHAGPRSLPARKTFTGCSHVYDWFSKSTPTAASPVSS